MKPYTPQKRMNRRKPVNKSYERAYSRMVYTLRKKIENDIQKTVEFLVWEAFN